MAAKKPSKNTVRYAGTLNYDSIRIEHQSYLKRLNDVLVETALTVQGLQEVLSDVDERIADGQTNYTLKVPNKKSKKVAIRRNLGKLKTTLSDTATPNTYVRSLVFLVALVEDYISTNLRRTIRAYPQKLLISSKGRKLAAHDQFSVDVRDLVAAGDYDAVIDQLASQRVRDAIYASPAQYLECLKAICGVEISEGCWPAFVEIKATRDLFIHAEGVVNEIYVGKAGERARFAVGETASIDSLYFDQATSCLKALTSEIYVGMRGKYCSSVELRRIFDRENSGRVEP